MSEKREKARKKYHVERERELARESSTKHC